MYTRKQVAAIFFAAGTLFGVLLAFASCSATEPSRNSHITTVDQ
jgi:hypothetical protein